MLGGAEDFCSHLEAIKKALLDITKNYGFQRGCFLGEGLWRTWGVKRRGETYFHFCWYVSVDFRLGQCSRALGCSFACILGALQRMKDADCKITILRELTSHESFVFFPFFPLIPGQPSQRTTPQHHLAFVFISQKVPKCHIHVWKSLELFSVFFLVCASDLRKITHEKFICIYIYILGQYLTCT